MINKSGEDEEWDGDIALMADQRKTLHAAVRYYPEDEMKPTVTTTKEVPVRYLRARCGVRYWEDATVDGVEDETGSLIPCRDGESWCPVIDLENGRIVNWEPGVMAQIHYKVCDDGEYDLLDEEKVTLIRKEGYVPSMLSPKENGFGDYVILDVNGDGFIQGFKADLSEFEEAA